MASITFGDQLEITSSGITRKMKNSIDLLSSKPSKMSKDVLNDTPVKPKKQILLNAFDSASVGHRYATISISF